MKLPLLPKKKLRATAARRAPSRAIEEQEEEPTVRLSSAFVIVLLLHVVAIGGIYTFESIKVHRRNEEPLAAAVEKAPKPETATASTAATTAAPTSSKPASSAKPSNVDLLTASVRPADLEASKKAAPAAPAPARETQQQTIHVVVKGENPHSIARKYGVKYDELLRINKITDPTKLQIGQKLVIPARPRN